MRTAMCLLVTLIFSSISLAFQSSSSPQSSVVRPQSSPPQSSSPPRLVAGMPKVSVDVVSLPADQPRSFMQRLKAGEPPAVSALGTCCGALCTLAIGILAFRLNRNIRRGQAAHEQIRMLLEIDTELIKSPELWAVHGPEFIAAHTGPAGASVLLAELTEHATSLVKSAETTIPLAKTEQGRAAIAKLAESIAVLAKMAEVATSYAKLWEELPVAANPAATGDIKQGGNRTTDQLRLLALLLRYFNMFDFVYVSWGRKWWLWGKRKGEWDAWVKTMTEFFRDNCFARDEWTKFSAKGIYSPAFTKFLNHLLAPATK